MTTITSKFYVFIVILIFFNTTLFAGENYGSRFCKENSNFICYKVKRNDSWESLFKDPETRDAVMRLNRMNTSIYRGMIIAIPKNSESLSMMEVSPFPQQILPPGDKFIYVSLSDLAFAAYDDNGTLQYWGPVSGGRGYCPDINRGCHTKLGTFSIFRKEGSGCFSTKFPVGRGGAPMPYCMFFNGGFALHGSYEVPGYNASHGCVRMFIKDAKWLNQNFIMDRTDVHVVIRE